MDRDKNRDSNVESLSSNEKKDRGFGLTRFVRDHPVISTAVGATLAVGVLGAMRYHVAATSEYIAKTGLGIADVCITKNAIQWPFQKIRRVSMVPHNYSFELSAMSREKMEFKLPGVFTIGPHNDVESLKKYVTFLNLSSEEMRELIKGVIEGETRVLAASLDIEDIFNGRDVFRQNIIDEVQKELGKFGLEIYNANVKELEDAPGSEYFIHMRQRKKADAENQARKDVATSKFEGDVAVKEKERDTRIRNSQYESDAVLAENARKIEISRSNAEFLQQKAEFDRMTHLSQLESKKAVEIKESELNKEVENRNIAQQTEKIRSEKLSVAVVEAEAKQKATDAELYTAMKEAEGIYAKYEAQARGLKALFDATDDPNVVLSYLMIKNEVYPKLAEANAKAINGLNPKITHWVTNGNDKNSNPIADLLKSIPPLVETIHDQTGIKPPSWLVDMSEAHIKNKV